MPASANATGPSRHSAASISRWRRASSSGFSGPNGAGKSTLVKILVGLVRPSGGSAEVGGRAGRSRAARAALGYLAELFRFPGWYTADEVLELHQRLAGSRGGAAERKRPARARGARRRRRPPRRRDVEGDAAAARDRQALVGEPRVLLLDEPTSALDPVGRRIVRELLEELRDRGRRCCSTRTCSPRSSSCAIASRSSAAGRSSPPARRTTSPPARGRARDRRGRTQLIESATREDAPRLVAEAVAAGRKVYGVRVLTSTLEEVYLEAGRGRDDVSKSRSSSGTGSARPCAARCSRSCSSSRLVPRPLLAREPLRLHAT